MSKAPLPWFGGKQLLAERLVALLPEHRVYCEPCGGAGSVLFSKPRSHLEVYNDADGDLVAFMRALRDEPAELRRLLEWTPFSREEFLSCASSYRTLAPSLERTRRWYVTVCQSLNACLSAGEERSAASSPRNDEFVRPPESDADVCHNPVAAFVCLQCGHRAVAPHGGGFKCRDCGAASA